MPALLDGPAKKDRLVNGLTSRSLVLNSYDCGVLLSVPALITSSIQKRTAYRGFHFAIFAHSAPIFLFHLACKLFR